MTTESIKEERFLIAAFPSPESSKFPRILADSSAYNSCSVEVRLSSLISDRPNSPFAVCRSLYSLRCELCVECLSVLPGKHTREPKLRVPDFESGWLGPLYSRKFYHRRFFQWTRSAESRPPPDPQDCPE